MLELNDLLLKAGAEPAKTMVFRHRPSEAQLRRVFPWIASEHPEMFNAYQQSHSPKVEKSLMRAEWVASFIGTHSKEAVFVGLYRQSGSRPISFGEFWEIPENRALKKHGMLGAQEEQPGGRWFDLQKDPAFSEWSGKLVVDWPGLERSWWRWADRNTIRVRSIADENLLVQRMPGADDLELEWHELQTLPKAWEHAIRQWRGIYLIVDQSDGKAYVGSAAGSDNIYGRWMNYAEAGHGGNVQLRSRKPENFRFSILQLLAQDTPVEAVVAAEGRWKDRLLTRRFGLNSN